MGVIPGASYNRIVEGFEAFEAHVRSRSVGEGEYLPLDLRFGVPSTAGFTFWGILHLLLLAGGGAMLAVAATFCLRPAIAGVHYLTASHPAEPALNKALAREGPVDTMAVVRALETAVAPETAAKPPPEFVSRSYARRADALAERLESDARLAEAIAARERARADAEYWKREPHRSLARAAEAQERIAELEREIASLRRQLAEKATPPAPPAAPAAKPASSAPSAPASAASAASSRKPPPQAPAATPRPSQPAATAPPVVILTGAGAATPIRWPPWVGDGAPPPHPRQPGPAPQAGQPSPPPAQPKGKR